MDISIINVSSRPEFIICHILDSPDLFVLFLIQDDNYSRRYAMEIDL